MLAAAVCPRPPMLVPEVAAGAADDLAELREACGDAVLSILGTDPARVVVVAEAPGRVFADEAAGGSFGGFGVDLRAGGAEGALPPGHTMGAWLLDRAGWTGQRLYASEAVAPEKGDVWLVVADGSAKRSDTAPGYLDPRAEAFDAEIGRALAAGDPRALAAIDAELADELWCTGAEPLRLFGEAVTAETRRGAHVKARLRYDGAPRGVGYWVADWRF